MNNAVGSTYFDFHHNCSFHRQSKISAAGAESDNEPHVIEPAPDSGGQDSGTQDSGTQGSRAQGSRRASKYFKVIKDS